MEWLLDMHVVIHMQAKSKLAIFEVFLDESSTQKYGRKVTPNFRDVTNKEIIKRNSSLLALVIQTIRKFVT